MSEQAAANKVDTSRGLPAKLWSLVRGTLRLFKDAAVSWYKRDPFQSGAIIAFYTVFSLPGLMVIIVALVGYLFGTDAVAAEISNAMGGPIGERTAANGEDIVSNAKEVEGSPISSIIGIATLIFGATGVFYQLQSILNRIWGVKVAPKRVWLKVIRARIFSFGMVLTMGFLLLVSLAASAALAAFADVLESEMSEAAAGLVVVGEFAISLGVIGLLFATIFKFLPDAEIRWRAVWVGALLTAVLFVIAKSLLGVWLANMDLDSTYGAAGTVILILLWVFYSALILLYGAEFTRTYANRFGHEIKPARDAVAIES